MQNYNIFVDISKSQSRPNEATTYQISVCPFTRGEGGSGVGAKQYLTNKEAFIADLQQKLGYTNDSIVHLFAVSDGHQPLPNHPLSDEDAAHFGWD